MFVLSFANFKSRAWFRDPSGDRVMPRAEARVKAQASHGNIIVLSHGNFPEKMFENLGIPHEVVLFFGNYANSQFSYLALVLLAASWTSHARMTATRIRKWKYCRIFPLLCR